MLKGRPSLTMIVILTAAFMPDKGTSEVRWKVAEGTTPPRSDADGLTTAQCGGVAKGSNITSINKNGNIDLKWEETVNKEGYFVVTLYKNQNDELSEPTVLIAKYPDDQNEAIVDAPHSFSQAITMPDFTCNSCVLQLQQVTGTNENQTIYYSCADITLTVPTTVSDNGQPSPPSGLTVKIKAN